MGKYRVCLVLFSFIIMYVDVYINKTPSSYFVSSSVFFAMLLYDYEKMNREATNKFDRIFSNFGATTYLIILFINFVCTILSFYKLITFKENQDSMTFKLDLVILKDYKCDFGMIFTILFIFLLGVTMIEVFRANYKTREQSSVESTT
ncbi:hypothetical protein COK92_20595 [Bacillus anthracis]|nr:hypothetical protein COK92_20595 [Bacillus anthracis]